MISAKKIFIMNYYFTGRHCKPQMTKNNSQVNFRSHCVGLSVPMRYNNHLII